MFQVRAILINTILAVFDLVITAACFVVLLPTELGGGNTAGQVLFSPEGWLAFGCALAVWLALLFYLGMYQSRRMDSVFADLGILAKVALAGFVLLAALAHFVRGLQPTPLFLPSFAALDLMVLGVSRIGIRVLLREVRRRGHNIKKVLLVASPAIGERLCRKLEQRSHFGYRILRRLEYQDASAEAWARLLEGFREALSTQRVDDVILALPSEARAYTAQLVNECEDRGINVRLVPDLFPLIQSDTQVYNLDGIPLVNVHLYATETFGYLVLKRVFDLAVSFVVIVIFSPLFLLIALLVKLTSPGPVLFVQERVGLNGRKFQMLKFRTMRVNSGLDSETHWTTRCDANLTWLGSWLRRSNLDELPQFFNVLKGEMSIVGPRPERPFFIQRFREEIPDYMLRHYVKCGITGWAQVNGWRGDTSIRERLAHDLYYMRHWALGLDLKILLLTLTRSFFHRNAY